ncbi:MAG TPA: chemotaxis protein CheW [Geobacter sp.]|nr:chemotaxis protein CheW [Geobacter sp.]
MGDDKNEITPPGVELQAAEPEQTREQRGKILHDRAQRLALERKVEEPGERIEVVEFLLGTERFGVETSFVREVHPLRGLTPLPCVPPFVLGLMNLRGAILSVVDLRSFFETGREEVAESSKVIVLRLAAMEFGILAQAVLGVRALNAADLQPPLPSMTGARSEFLRGMAGRLLLLDAAKLLSDRRLVVHEEA